MKRLLFILFLIFILGCRSYVVIEGEKIVVEQARTISEKQQGLMYRDELCESCGMLFTYDEEDKYSFWMKNTLIPLDMIFIDSDLRVVDILHAVPCVEDPCISYTPKEDTLYVLETNGNKFNANIIGEKVKIHLR